MQPPLDLIVQGGAVVVLALWVWDLRKQRDDLQKRLDRIVDALEIALKKQAP